MSRRIQSIGGHTALLLLLAGLAACGDGTGPVPSYDPLRTLDQLEDVLIPMDDSYDLLLGLDLAVATLDYYSYDGSWGLAVQPLRVAVEGPEAGSGNRFRGLLRRPSRRAQGAATPGLAPDLARFTVPGGLLGRTLVWDPVDGYVISGRSGAPGDGVRLVLYRMDADTGYPAEPLSEIGVLDLIDRDDGGAERVRVRAIETAGPDRVIADYTVSYTGSGGFTEGQMELRADGTLGAPTTVDLDVFQRLTWSESQDRDHADMRYTFRRGGRSLHLEADAESRYDASAWERLNFDLELRGERPEVDIEAAIRGDRSVDGRIRADGRTAIRIGGYDGDPWFERPDDRPLDAYDIETLREIWSAIGDLMWYTEWILAPADLLILAG